MGVKRLKNYKEGEVMITHRESIRVEKIYDNIGHYGECEGHCVFSSSYLSLSTGIECFFCGDKIKKKLPDIKMAKTNVGPLPLCCECSFQLKNSERFHVQPVEVFQIGSIHKGS